MREIVIEGLGIGVIDLESRGENVEGEWRKTVDGVGRGRRVVDRLTSLVE